MVLFQLESRMPKSMTSTLPSSLKSPFLPLGGGGGGGEAPVAASKLVGSMGLASVQSSGRSKSSSLGPYQKRLWGASFQYAISATEILNYVASAPH